MSDYSTDFRARLTADVTGVRAEVTQGWITPAMVDDPPTELEVMAAEQGTALARGLLAIADAAGMPDSYWQTDSRVALARRVLDVPEDGRTSHAHLWETP